MVNIAWITRFLLTIIGVSVWSFHPVTVRDIACSCRSLSTELFYDVIKNEEPWDQRPVRNFWNHNDTFPNNYVFESRMVPGLHDGLKMHRIPRTEILVSELCLGTMTFGQQVSKDEAYGMLDMAFNKYGINFVDSSELFPGPFMEKTQYRSERILGHWMKERGVRREELVISTKIEGYDFYETQDGEPRMKRFIKEKFLEDVDRQLKRLGTDYIDVLHLGSPDRAIRMPGDPANWRFHRENPFWNMTVTVAQLEAVDTLVKQGKIRHFGLTDETPFGAAHFATAALLLNLPSPVLLQQTYNLLERNEFDLGLAEVCQPTTCAMGLMAKTALAGGALTGKYLDPAYKSDLSGRLRKFPGTWMGRYLKPSAVTATRKLKEVCDRLHIPLSAASLAFVTSRDFITSTLIGATNTAQLEDNILSLNVPFTSELAAEVERIATEDWDPSRGRFEYIDPSLDWVDPATLPWGGKDTDVDPQLEELLNQGEQIISGEKKIRKKV